MDIKAFSILPLLIYTLSAYAEPNSAPNYCHNPDMNRDWEKRIAEYPEDPIIIKLAGLRIGLCQMIDKGQIRHEQGIDLWEEERQQGIVERKTDEAKKHPKYIL